jgi:multisubunit Na+/H+ antiporter MnhE subunit
LPAGAARVFFYGVISLLPGTAVVRVDENQVCVHALEAVSEESSGALRVLEDRVAAVFGVVLEGRR